MGADRAHAAWLLGERPSDAPPTNYSRLSVDQIMKTYGRALELFWVNPRATTSYAAICAGSSIILQDQALAAFLKFLAETVEKTQAKAHSDFTRRHNRRALHCYFILALATGHRPVKSPFERVQDFDFDTDWIVIDDKNSKTSHLLSQTEVAMKISKSQIALTAFVTLTVVTACTPPASTPATSAQLAPSPSLDQLDICQVREEGVAKTCKSGQKIAFLPPQFGNEQYPVVFAAANCDLRYTVAMTTGGVTCIYLGAQSVDGKLIDPPPTPKADAPANGVAAPVQK